MSKSTERASWWNSLRRWSSSSRPTQAIRRRVHLAVERLERRDVMDNTISGTVVQTLNVAGLFPEPSANFFGPVQGVAVRLNNGAPQMTGADGTYSFGSVAAGTHTVSIDLPAGFLGFNAQSLSYTINYVGPADFANLNFALTPKNDALIQNLFELVLHRPADFDGFNTQVDALDGGSSVGRVFSDLYTSAEFNNIVKPVAGFLEAFFPGPLDIGKLRNSVELQNLGISQDATILDILYSQEFVAEFGDTSLLSDSDYVKFLYNNLLNRNPSKKALNQWVDELQSGMNRGELALEIVDLRAFQRRRAIQRSVGVSLVYLGVLGREATAAELQKGVRSQRSLARIANNLANSAEFEALPGFTDTFYWDVLAQQSKPSVDVLSRLQIYNPATQEFDIAVAANSISSTAANPKNVYFIAHGWAPGSTQAVLIGSTPGNPLKSWETANTDDPDPAWLYEPTNQVSSQGLAQAIINADPLAIVVAYSWIDLSATPDGNDTLTVTESASTINGNTTITVDASQLGVGMTVTGPGIAAGTTVSFIASQTSVILSTAPTATQNNVSLTFSGPNVAKAIEQFLYAGQSESRTQWSGLLLARAIEEALAPGFFTPAGQGLLHLLGHSHGSKVATVATLALKKASVPVSHLTLFESPEAGPTFDGLTLHAPSLGGAENFLWYYLKDIVPGRTPISGTRSATGNTFVDNYFSQEGFGSGFGRYHEMNVLDGMDNIVDVLMHPEDLYGSLSISDVQKDATILFGSHDYPPAWYGQASLQNPNGPANTLNGLRWSPLIDPATTAALDPYYEQKQQATPGQFLQTQFELDATAGPAPITPTFTDLEYAQQYQFGQVVDTGTSITLSVDADNAHAINKITFNPLGAQSTSGTGMDFTFDFEGVDPGEKVELIIWIHGMASVPQDAITKPLGNTIGYISIPLFSMDGADAGTAPQSATISLDGYRVGLILGPFNSVIDISGGSATPIVPTLGFSLATSNGATASVVVSNLRQFSDGIS